MFTLRASFRLTTFILHERFFRPTLGILVRLDTTHLERNYWCEHFFFRLALEQFHCANFSFALLTFFVGAFFFFRYYAIGAHLMTCVKRRAPESVCPLEGCNRLWNVVRVSLPEMLSIVKNVSPRGMSSNGSCTLKEGAKEVRMSPRGMLSDYSHWEHICLNFSRLLFSSSEIVSISKLIFKKNASGYEQVF